MMGPYPGATASRTPRHPERDDSGMGCHHTKASADRAVSFPPWHAEVLRQWRSDAFPGEATMSDRQPDEVKRVRHFRQIIIWPLQLLPIRKGAQIQEPWQLLEQSGGSHPWSEVRDEFGCDPGEFQQRHYSEFVTFLPYVRSFLYGEAKGDGAGPIESPIRVFRRSDVAKLRMVYPETGTSLAPVTFNVAHIDLCFFYDIDVVIPVVEIYADDLSLTCAQETMYRFGRAYPTYWRE